MNPLTSADETPGPTLSRGAMGQARVPLKRYCHGSPVSQIDEEVARGYADRVRLGPADIRLRRTHSTLSVTLADAAPQDPAPD
jgi:hypothetical protein